MPESLHTLKICTWNFRGLAASIPYLRALYTQYEVVCITEHWLHHTKLQKLGEISKHMNFLVDLDLNGGRWTYERSTSA